MLPPKVRYVTNWDVVGIDAFFFMDNLLFFKLFLDLTSYVYFYYWNILWYWAL